MTKRRSFLKQTAFGASMAMFTNFARRSSAAIPDSPVAKSDRLPREVWIASISQHGLRAENHRQMSSMVLARMEEVAAFHPDIVCLPEVFPFTNVKRRASHVSEMAEEPIGEISQPFSDFAQRHGCYVFVPTYTKENGHCYNSAVLLDRQGQYVGEYRKMHPTTGEMAIGVVAGPLDPPVFKTDFGVIGAQICFDIEWTESWQKLRQAGAEIVFWPSAYAGGSMVDAKAWQNKYCVVSSTNKDTSKICDVTGETVARTSRWNQSICAPVNLEKAFLHTWPYVQRFGEIHAKYGRKVSIRNFAEEEWTILESRSADVRVADVLKEFELLTHEEHIQSADAAQCSCRV